MTTDDVTNLLDKYLLEFPEMKDADSFDKELETRRRLLKQLQSVVDGYHTRVEHIWADKAWKLVRHKPSKWYIRTGNKNMSKLIITCHPTPRSTNEGMKRILRTVQELAANCGVKITWKEEPEDPI